MDGTGRGHKISEDIRASIAKWREHEGRTKYFGQKASENPSLYASSAFYHIRGTRRHLRRLLRKRFGVKVRYFGFRSKQYIASQKRFPNYSPRSPQEYYDYVQFRAMSNLLRVHDVLWFAMHSAYIKAHHAGKDPDDAACAALFRCLRMEPIASPTKREEPDDVLREMSAINLAGWIGPQVNRTTHWRVGAVLNEISGGSRSGSFTKFIEELLPAMILAWSERQPGEPLKSGSGETNLVSRVEGQLERLGSQAAKLDREGKLSETVSDSVADTEENELEEFERRETLQQELNALKGWVEQAKFSEDEARVYMLDMQTNFDTKFIAQELGKDPSTVRQHRKRYHDKIRKATGS